MSSELHLSVTPETLAEVLRKTGYRATVVDNQGRPQVRSAAQGIGFFIAFGAADTSAVDRYADFAFQCWISIEAELRPDLIEGWNQKWRFARLFRQDALLVLTMDVLVAGGVSENHLRAYCELWDNVIRDFIRHLRQGDVKAPV